MDFILTEEHPKTKFKNDFATDVPYVLKGVNDLWDYTDLFKCFMEDRHAGDALDKAKLKKKKDQNLRWHACLLASSIPFIPFICG